MADLETFLKQTLVGSPNDIQRLRDISKNLSEDVIAGALRKPAGKGRLLIHWLIEGNHVDIVDELLGKLNPNLRCSLCKLRDGSGRTILHLASKLGRDQALAAVLKLIPKDCLLNVLLVNDSEGKTCLQSATDSTTFQIICNYVPLQEKLTLAAFQPSFRYPQVLDQTYIPLMYGCGAAVLSVAIALGSMTSNILQWLIIFGSLGSAICYLAKTVFTRSTSNRTPCLVFISLLATYLNEMEQPFRKRFLLMHLAGKNPDLLSAWDLISYDNGKLLKICHK